MVNFRGNSATRRIRLFRSAAFNIHSSEHSRTFVDNGFGVILVMGELCSLRLFSRRQKNLLAESPRHNFHQLDFNQLFDILTSTPRGGEVVSRKAHNLETQVQILSPQHCYCNN